MGIEFLLVLGLVVAASALVPAMAHANDDRPDPEKIKEASTAQAELNAQKREGQGLDRRAVEQSRRLTQDAQQRLALEKQRAEALAKSNEAMAAAAPLADSVNEQLATLQKQKALSVAITPTIDTGAIAEATREGAKSGFSQALSFVEDHWAKILGGLGTAVVGGLGAKGFKALKRVKQQRKVWDADELKKMKDLQKGKKGSGLDDLGDAAKTGGKKKGFTGGLATGLGASGGLYAMKDEGPMSLLGGGIGRALGTAVVSPAMKSLYNMLGGLPLMLNEATAEVRAFTNLAKDEDPYKALVDNIYDTNAAWRQHGLEVKQIAELNANLVEQFRQFSNQAPATQREIVNTAAMMTVLGVDTGASAKNFEIMASAMGLSGKQSTQFTKEIAATGDALNMNLNNVFQQFSGMEDKLVQFGANSSKAMRELMLVSKNTNIPMNDLLGTLDRFDTFDEAANAAGNLNALLGGEFINDIELMNASLEGDTLKVMEMVQGALENSAVSWDDMNAAQKKAISEATGIGMGNLARIARGELTADMAATTDAAMTEQRAKELATQGRGITENIAQTMKGAETLLTTGKFLEGAPQQMFERTADIPHSIPGKGMDWVVTEVADISSKFASAITQLNQGINLSETTTKALGDILNNLTLKLDGSVVTLKSLGDTR